MDNSSSTTKLAKGDYVTAPETTSEYLTSNENYLVQKVFIDKSFIIKDNEGERIFCRIFNCGHLNGMDWIIKT